MKSPSKSSRRHRRRRARLSMNKQLSAKARQYLAFLQRDKQAAAVVEFVFSASRFKLLVSKEHVLVSFVLAEFALLRPAPWTDPASRPTLWPRRSFSARSNIAHPSSRNRMQLHPGD